MIYPVPVGATINSATLNLYTISGGGFGVNIYPLTMAWQESSVTWGFPWTTSPGGAFATSPSYSPTIASGAGTYDITLIVQYWQNNLNYGVILTTSPSRTAQAVIATKENPTNPIPTLSVNYSYQPTATQLINTGLSNILALPDSDFRHDDKCDRATDRFMRLCNSANKFIAQNKLHKAKEEVKKIIKLMDGDKDDLLTDASAQASILPYFQQAESLL